MERKRRDRLAASGSTMDPELWGTLPEELVEKVVSFLPFASLFRARAVCKGMTSFIFSQKFQEARADLHSWADLSSEAPYFLVFVSIQGQRICTAYDAGSNRWRCMPPMPGLPSQAKDVVAGDGGLLCFRDVDEQGRVSLFVYNPVTQKCRELPPMPPCNSMTKHTWILTHMVVDRFTSVYKIMVVFRQHNIYARMAVYNSESHTWMIDCGLLALQRRYNLSFHPQIGACCDNFFYFVANEVKGRCETGIVGLVVYDLFEGAWREKILYRCEPRCPGSRLEAQVVECNGTVFMVLREDDTRGTKGMSICRLNPSREQKIEESMLFEAFFAKWGFKFPAFQCISVKNELGLLLNDRSFKVLVEDFSEELMLPTCPYRGIENLAASSSIACSKFPYRQMMKVNLVSGIHFCPNPDAQV